MRGVGFVKAYVRTGGQHNTGRTQYREAAQVWWGAWGEGKLPQPWARACPLPRDAVPFATRCGALWRRKVIGN
eukprot:352001-Chlamydomonas_euryale.AAC.8